MGSRSADVLEPRKNPLLFFLAQVHFVADILIDLRCCSHFPSPKYVECLVIDR